MRVLIVDDEGAVRDSLALLVQSLGYIARTASSGHEALSILCSETFDLIMLDLRMPGLSGIETWQQIKLRAAKPLGILFTAAAEGPELAQLHGLRFMEKPFSLDVLDQALKSTREQLFTPATQAKLICQEQPKQ